MAGAAERPGPAEPGEHFIPVGKGELAAALRARLGTGGTDPAAFDDFCRLLGSILHYEHYDERERLKEDYRHFSPHARPSTAAANAAAYTDLIRTLRAVLARANFIEIPADELASAPAGPGLLRVEVRADTEHYRDVLFYRRGRHRERLERKSWFGLRVRHVDIDVYDDVVLMAAVRDAAPEPERSRWRPWRRPKPSAHRPGSLIIKCFRDIPSADLKALLPEARIVMAQKDKLLIGLPALFGGIPILLKLGPMIAVVAILLGLRFGTVAEVSPDRLEQALIVTSGLLALGGFVLQQWLKYQRQALRYQLEVNGNLYFRNVSNNAGMFDAIIGAAEEQEFKEAALAYAFLLDAPRSRAALDRAVEAWLLERFGVHLDFEIDDGVDKLLRLGLVSEAGGILVVPPVREAIRRLDRRWDAFFPPPESTTRDSASAA